MPVMPGEEIRIGDAILEVVTRFEEDHDAGAGGFGDLQGTSMSMRRLYRMLERIARHDAPVLLVGESGTGKELAARALHEAGARAEQPFVAINCAAIPERLVASELFGHEKGAFTGAERRSVGAFVRADRGTLFLDELGEMSLDAQASLLRVLETGEVRPVGSAETEYPDVRVVAATNRDLGKMVREGLFRRDLLHRLAVLAVRLPPLRDRRDDIPELVEVLLARHHPGARASDAAIDALAAYDWPGNVRELRNVLTRAVVLGGDLIDADALSFSPWAFEEVEAPCLEEEDNEDDERERFLAALRRHGGNRTRAARDLGIPRTSFHYKLMKLGISQT
jgi:DNA-binding NtrC family response regulator